MKTTNLALLGTLAAAMFVSTTTTQGAFIIEPRPGKAFTNFSVVDGTNSVTTTDSAAFGLTPGNGSAYGGTGAFDEYVFRYTPGTDLDNTVITAGMDLGNGDLATGLVGGLSGTYNVYVTWPLSANVSGGGSDITLVNSASPGSPLITLNDVIQDSDDPGVSPGADVWFLIGSASLTAGQTYELHYRANNATFVSQRIDGVMFEVQPVPEPSTIALGLIGAGCAVMFIRRRK